MLGRNSQPSCHSRMETADVSHDAGSPQNCPAGGSRRKIDVEAAVGRGRRMLKDLGIPPFNCVVDMQPIGRGPKCQLVDFDHMRRFLRRIRKILRGEGPDNKPRRRIRNVVGVPNHYE